MNNKEIKVSIIIPVYNLEKHIERCIDSVSNQILREIEIIVINDGSLDKSIEVIKKCSMKDDRVVIINQENSGVSSARNKGLDIAKGKYITFVDGDDYIDKNMLTEMYEIGERQNLDLIFCNLSSEVEKEYKESYFETNINILKMMIDGSMSKTACGILFKLELIRRNIFTFATDMSYGEDFLFTSKSLIETKNLVGVIPKQFYIVEERQGSATRRFNRNRFEQVSKLNQRLCRLIEAEGLIQEFKKPLFNYFCQNIFSSVTNIVKSDDDSFLGKLYRLRFIKNSYHTKNVLNSVIKNELSIKSRFKIFLLKYINVIFIYIVYRYINR